MKPLSIVTWQALYKCQAFRQGNEEVESPLNSLPRTGASVLKQLKEH
jgi:hypothetical protein